MASASEEVTVSNLAEILHRDDMVKLAGVDVDGMLRGKLVSKSKFLSVAEEGFGFCSVIFGWDMHDMTYFRELRVSNKENGYRDLIAVPDLKSYRRIPWEDDVPFFLVSFHDPDTKDPVSVCPRGILRTVLERVQEKGYGAMAGGEFGVAAPAVHATRANITNNHLHQPSTSSSSSGHPLPTPRPRSHPLPPSSPKTRHHPLSPSQKACLATA